MASQSFQALRRLQDSGASLPLVLSNPAWQALMDRIDANISERSSVLERALEKIPTGKRPAVDFPEEDSTESSKKRQRVGSDLSSRKEALLAKIDGIEGGSDKQDDYEAYRRQCWIQYYEWMEKQKQGGVSDGRPQGDVPVQSAANETSSEDEDEEIHNALLGLS